MNTSLQTQIRDEPDPARVLARAFKFILSWSAPDAQPETRERDERETKASNDDEDEK